MPTKLIDLRPDRALLNSDFDGYKLSLSQIPTVSKQLPVKVDRLLPDTNQFSLLHGKLFGLHNHLFPDDRTSDVYFVDSELNVQKVVVDGAEISLITLWQVPKTKSRSSGDFNASLKFLSNGLVVVADGMGLLFILDRGSDKWTVKFSDYVMEPEQRFVLTDAVYKALPQPQLHVLLTSIRQSEHYVTVLNWVTLELSDSWNQVAFRELVVNGYVQFANLERNCGAIYVVSDSGCKFTLDSENEVQDSSPENGSTEKVYKWSQSPKGVTLKFARVEGVNDSLVKVATESGSVKIEYGDEILLEGCLWQRVEAGLTSWFVENDVLEISLQKTEAGLVWPEVVEGDQRGEYVQDFAGNGQNGLAHFTSSEEEAPASGTTFNSQQIEECDFESDKLTIFERICRDTHLLTHKVNLGSHQVLLNVKLESDEASAIGIRSDVDTCIWQPTSEPDFTLAHKGTLLALGYIQASKQQMKFFVTSPHLNYSVICEAVKHIFIYCQNKTIGDNELRNRTTGRRYSALAQQQVLSLPTNEEILGIYASNTHLYVLGETFITVLKI